MNNDPNNHNQGNNQGSPQPGFKPPVNPQQPPQHSSPQQNTHQQHIENPGQTLGIIGLVLNFFAINVAGIILGILSRNKSKKANMSTTLGTISLVWGIVGTVIGLLVTAFLVLAFLVSFAGYESQIQEAQQEIIEREKQRESEFYYDEFGNAEGSEQFSPSELETYQYNPEESI